jgi:uncharacterized protein YuzE
MAVLELKPKDIARMLRAAPVLTQFPAKRLSVDYDAEADVLYISFRRPQRATDSEMRDNGTIIHRRGKQIVGLTILEASKR